LEGLEVAVLSYSEARAADSTGRLDSSFFEKRYLKLRQRAKQWQSLSNHAKSVVCGPFGSNLLNDNYVERGIPMIRPFNLRNARVDRGEIAYLSPKFVADSGLKTFSPGAIMFARVGEIGAGINLYEETTISPNIIVAELHDTINPYFVGVFANTQYGRMQLEAGMKVVAQPTISTDAIRDFKIPLLNRAFQDKIAETFKQAVVKENESVDLLKQAESILICELGLERWITPEPLTYVRNSSEAFAAGRLDAEHFQPKFVGLLNHLESTGDSERLDSVLTTNQRGKQPEYAEAGLPVVNSKHVLSGEVRLDTDNRKAVSDDKTFLIQTGDVLMNGTGVGTIGRCAPYLHEIKAIPDNHVTILRPKADLDPIYLSVFLNSLAGQMQVSQRLRGSSGQIELYPNDIAQFKVWVAPPETQANIRRAVENSFEQKQRATQLLEAAKHAVEIAIEQSEADALAYLNNITATTGA